MKHDLSIIRCSHSLRLSFVIMLIAGLVSTALRPPAAYAATITVSTTADELNADSDCSLREAIVAANTDTAVDACPAGSCADTINLPAGNYVLSIAGMAEDATLTGDLDITQSLTISGAGPASTTVDANSLDRVFQMSVTILRGTRPRCWAKGAKPCGLGVVPQIMVGLK